MSRFFALMLSWLLAASAGAQGNKTIIGPRNVDLAEGAQLILAGDAKEGVRRTLRGLDFAAGDREINAALSNLCGGYLLLRQFDEALRYCNLALKNNENNWRAYNNRALVYIEIDRLSEAEADLERGLSIAPESRTLRKANELLQDKLNPVSPTITIDDRQPDAEL